MTTFIIIVIIVFIGFIVLVLNTDPASVQGPTNYQTPSRQKTTVTQPLPTVAELIAGIETVKQLEEFEKKYEAVERKLSEDYDNKYQERLYRRYESAYNKIADRIGDKAFYYQYVPHLELDLKAKHLSIAYAYFTPDEYKIHKRGTNAFEWDEITGNELMEGGKVEDALTKPPANLDTLKKFREIVDTKTSTDEKLLKLTGLVEQNASFKNEFFNDPNVPIETQILSWLLEPYKVPQLDKMIALGHNSVSKLKSLSDEDLLNINGFGQTTLTKFKAALKRIK